MKWPSESQHKRWTDAMNDLVIWGESEEDLRVMVGQFAEVCRRRELKVNAVKE